MDTQTDDEKPMKLIDLYSNLGGATKPLAAEKMTDEGCCQPNYTVKRAYRGIGNAVSVPVARTVGEALLPAAGGRDFGRWLPRIVWASPPCNDEEE
jgi:hypothetical protein